MADFLQSQIAEAERQLDGRMLAKVGISPSFRLAETFRELIVVLLTE
jgi:hypothetical protein